MGGTNGCCAERDSQNEAKLNQESKGKLARRSTNYMEIKNDSLEMETTADSSDSPDTAYEIKEKSLINIYGDVIQHNDHCLDAKRHYWLVRSSQVSLSRSQPFCAPSYHKKKKNKLVLELRKCIDQFNKSMQAISVLQMISPELLDRKRIIKFFKERKYDLEWFALTKRKGFVGIVVNKWPEMISILTAIKIYHMLQERISKHSGSANSLIYSDLQKVKFAWNQHVDKIVDCDVDHFLYITALVIRNLNLEIMKSNSQISMLHHKQPLYHQSDILSYLLEIKMDGYLFRKCSKDVFQLNINRFIIDYQHCNDLEIIDQYSANLHTKINQYNVNTISAATIKELHLDSRGVRFVISKIASLTGSNVVLKYGENYFAASNDMLTVTDKATKSAALSLSATEFDDSTSTDDSNNSDSEQQYGPTQYDAECTGNINSCTALQRLLLRMLTIKKLLNNEDRQYAVKCLINSSLLNDYIHLVDVHRQNIFQVKELFLNSFGACNIQECEYTKRHGRNRYRIQDQYYLEEPNLILYQNILASLHFFVFHLFDVGLRVHGECKQQLGRTHNHQTTKENANKFEMPRANKFNITLDIESSLTFMDELVERVNGGKIKHYLEAEEYDTDCVKLDMMGDAGNIVSMHFGQHCITKITQMIKSLACMSIPNFREGFVGLELLYIVRSSSFNIGFTFYYWDHYRNMDEFDGNVKYRNIYDHGGYTPKQLFVPPKYDSFKKELLHYQYISISTYKKIILPKVTAYIDTKKARSIRAIKNGLRYDDDQASRNKYKYGVHQYEMSNILKYDIKEGTHIKKDHLLSLILYTDFTHLSTDFSSTFRPAYPYESIASIKQRNSSYYWMSRRLRETVQLFGDRDPEEIPHPRFKNASTVNRMAFEKQYFTGLSAVLCLPSYQIRLCSQHQLLTRKK